MHRKSDGNTHRRPPAPPCERMGDPRGCAGHMHRILKADGTWMIVEPIAGDRPEDNMNPVGRLYYNASTMICVPTSLDQEVGEGLGAQAGETKLTEVIRDGGFTRVRRATAGPFNMILEARANRTLVSPISAAVEVESAVFTREWGSCPVIGPFRHMSRLTLTSAFELGCVKTLRGITAPGILGSTVTRRVKKRKNLSSARHYDQIRFRFHTAKSYCGSPGTSS